MKAFVWHRRSLCVSYMSQKSYGAFPCSLGKILVTYVPDTVLSLEALKQVEKCFLSSRSEQRVGQMWARKGAGWGAHGHSAGHGQCPRDEATSSGGVVCAGSRCCCDGLAPV